MNRLPNVSSISVLAFLLVLNFAFSSHATDEFGVPIRFAVIGDRTGGHTPGIHEEIISEINRLRPDFVMNVGDMIEGYSDDIDEIRGEWEEYLKQIGDFSVPLHPTPGNHDIWDDDTGQSLKLYEEFMGRPDYSFDYFGLHIVVLDTSRWEGSDELPQEKLDWLAEDLVNNRDAFYTLVFFHKPFWFETLAHGNPDPLHEIFKKYGVDAVFNGHFHEYFSGEYDGILYTSFGSSGGIMTPGVTGVAYHFGWVTVDGDGIHIAPIKKDSVLAWNEFTSADMVSVETIEKNAFHSNAPVPVGADTKFENAAWEFVLKNPGKLAVNDTMRWEIPKGWTVSPDSIPIELIPGAEKKVTVTVSCRGSLFPLPKFTLKIPYKENGTYKFSRGVKVMRRAMCTFADQPPKIDGRVDETGIWKNPVERLFGPEGGEAETETNRFYFAYDREYLYIATVSRESEPDKMHVSATGRDSVALFKDDCVGFFLIPPGRDNTLDNYQIYFNPNGAVFDQRIHYQDGEIENLFDEWNADCEVQVANMNGVWVLEARIPLKDLGVTQIASGDRWHVNFRRKQQRLGTSADWMVPINYEPEVYGEMVFE